MSIKTTKLNRKSALALLGIAAAVAYVTPTMMSLNQAHASGAKNNGGFMNFMGGGSGGGGGGKPRGFGSGAGGFVINDAITVKECGDCHQPYGADALPQGSWKRMMGNLANHFGENASLDEQTRAHIENYLVSNAPAGDGPLRITEMSWFAGEHNREVSQAAMKRAGSMANCAACHRQAGWTPKK